MIRFCSTMVVGFMLKKGNNCCWALGRKEQRTLPSGGLIKFLSYLTVNKPCERRIMIITQLVEYKFHYK